MIQEQILALLVTRYTDITEGVTAGFKMGFSPITLAGKLASFLANGFQITGNQQDNFGLKAENAQFMYGLCCGVLIAGGLFTAYNLVRKRQAQATQDAAIPPIPRGICTNNPECS